MGFTKNVVLNKSIGKHVLLGLAVVLLASCRLVITTDGTGHITSASGLMDCDQASCAFTIEHATTDTFTAVPADGYRFIRWSGICTRSPTEVCEATVAPLAEEYSEYDGDIGLYAKFESTSVKRLWYRDEDGDHYGRQDLSIMAFERPTGYSAHDTDCDDTDDSIHPWTNELEDGLDNNCNGKVDEGLGNRPFYLDSDGDGFGDPEISRTERYQPLGYISNDLDCDDSNASVNPDAAEELDGRDNDCDGSIDEGGTEYFRDVDGDGYGVSAGSIESFEPVDGYVTRDGDCDDSNADISPAADELFDSVDNDCDGLTDEGYTEREYYRDLDGDGYGDASDTTWDVEIPEGYVTNSTDNCVDTPNPSQDDTDEDGIGDACDTFNDSDDDGTRDSADNCPSVYNPGQGDEDGDGLGDACDGENGLDTDNDGVNTAEDNCPDAYNPSQSDSDGDGLGDACDAVDDSEPDGEGGDCSPSSEGQAMLDAVNAFRAQARECGDKGSFPAVPALSWSCELKEAALGHSMDMANNNFFSHTGSDDRDMRYRVEQAGYSWSSLGENIAAGYPTVSSAMDGWIGSPGHCANLMGSSFTELGSASFYNDSSTYGLYWTQVFGRPR